MTLETPPAFSRSYMAWAMGSFCPARFSFAKTDVSSDAPAADDDTDFFIPTAVVGLAMREAPVEAAGLTKADLDLTALPTAVAGRALAELSDSPMKSTKAGPFAIILGAL